MAALNTYESILYAHQQVKDWCDSAGYWARRFNEEEARGNMVSAYSLGASLELAREQATFWRNAVELRLAARAASNGVQGKGGE